MTTLTWWSRSQAAALNPAEAADPDLTDRQPRLRHPAGQRRDHVDTVLDQVAEEVEPPLAERREADVGGDVPLGDLSEERPSERVALEAAVPHGAEDLTVPNPAEELLGVLRNRASVLCGELPEPVTDTVALVLTVVPARRRLGADRPNSTPS